MNGHKLLGLSLGASLLLGYGTGAGAIPIAASTSAVVSKADVVILAGSEERGARQSGRHENRSGRQSGRQDNRSNRQQGR
jgi:hypothetical protein